MNEEVEIPVLIEQINRLIQSQDNMTNVVNSYIKEHQMKHEDETARYFNSWQNHSSMHGDMVQKVAKLETEMKLWAGIISIGASAVISAIMRFVLK